MTTEKGDLLAKVKNLAAARGADISDEPEQVDAMAWVKAQAESRWPGLCPARYQDADMDLVDPSAREVLQGWLADPTTNLVILGPCGVGKTYAAWAVLRRLHLAGVNIAGMSASDMLDANRPDRQRPLRYNASSVALLDDLAAERRTDWTQDVLTRWLDERHNLLRPVIATSNADTATLEEWLGPRAWSRLTGHKAVAIWIDGHDRRKEHRDEP